MALEGVELNPGTGGAVAAADTVGGLSYQVVKLATGADGTADLVGNSAPLPISDAGGSVTVDAPVGTPAFVRLSDGSAAITTLPVSLASVPSHAVTNAGTFATQVSSIAAGDNNIGNVDVVTLPALPAGSNAIGTVTAVGAAAENAAVSGNPVLAGGRYDSSARTLGNGDVGAMALNASGQLLVEIAAGAGSGGTAAADDADFTAGTTSGTPVMGAYQSSPTAVTDGDLGIVGITANREMKVAVSAGGITGVVEDAASSGGEEGVLAMAVRRDTAASSAGTDGDFATLNVDASGRLHVNVGNTVTVGSHAVTNAGTFATQVDGAALTALQLIDNACIADDAAFTPASSGVHMVGFTADETATDSVDEGDGGAARMTLDRKQIVTQYVHAAAGGHSPFRSLDVDETEDEVKASAGKLFWLHAMNMTAAVVYLKVYNNTAAGTTVGTTAPVLTFPIPTLGDTNGAGFAIHFGDAGLGFSTGICVAGLTGIADNDTTGVGANGLVVNAGFI